MPVEQQTADGGQCGACALFYDHIYRRILMISRVCCFLFAGLFFSVDFDASIPFQNLGRFHRRVSRAECDFGEEIVSRSRQQRRFQFIPICHVVHVGHYMRWVTDLSDRMINWFLTRWIFIEFRDGDGTHHRCPKQRWFGVCQSDLQVSLILTLCPIRWREELIPFFRRQNRSDYPKSPSKSVAASRFLVPPDIPVPRASKLHFDFAWVFVSRHSRTQSWNRQTK